MLPSDPVVSDKRQQLDRIIQAWIGLEVETVVDQPEAVPGETLKMRHTAVMRSRFPCSLDGGALPEHPAPAQQGPRPAPRPTARP